MSNDGVWVKVYPDAAGGAPGAAVISGHNGATVDTGKVIDGKTYDIYTFTDDTANDLSLTVAEPGGFADVLVVGAGGHGAGGAGGDSGGGGGAGGLIEARVFLEQGNNAVKVGGSPNYYGYAANGEASFIGNCVAPGGGVGCNGTYSTSGNGGSGGGGKATFAGDSLQGLGTPGFGHDGDKTNANFGGGGGADGPGVGTTGGPGKDVYITGAKMTLAAGGDGGGPVVSNPAPANSGNGGTTYSQGGSGIVIVRVEA